MAISTSWFLFVRFSSSLWYCNVQFKFMQRRDFLALCVSTAFGREVPLSPVIVKVHVLFDQAAHAGKGLTPAELALFHQQQQTCSREYAASGIQFDLHFTSGAYLRQQIGRAHV